jgi:hypothetical protein
MKEFILIPLMVFFSSCTISMINTSTHGSASDVVDSTPTTETKTDADVSLPIKAV